ncbi:MAG: tripartite tricarboxylate transporter TctB family protein [Gemmobacter sp.]|jgi:putative tricarboxylic transport membrane protein|nr:tripartite tricarboxylate transporter TctB family protein [Gemmobacter sp.]
MQGKQPRRPGELVFNIGMTLGSLYLLYSAWGISGFEALSAPGTVPMVTTAIMVICGALILWETLQKPKVTGERLDRDILPLPVIVTILMVLAYALALKPLGFLPTSFVFLTVMIRYLAGGSVIRAALLALLIVALVYGIFRLVFTVLMPPGIVPEGEILAFVRNLLSGKGN